jgi:hypothetical protein
MCLLIELLRAQTNYSLADRMNWLRTSRRPSSPKECLQLKIYELPHNKTDLRLIMRVVVLVADILVRARPNGRVAIERRQ